jgi:pantetheine-phosphate adenylyltransferase
MKNIAVFPGSFDPLTLGHVNIVQRGLKIFNIVIVAVATNISKRALFNEDERVALLKEVFRKTPRVKVDTSLKNPGFTDMPVEIGWPMVIKNVEIPKM